MQVAKTGLYNIVTLSFFKCFFFMTLKYETRLFELLCVLYTYICAFVDRSNAVSTCTYTGFHCFLVPNSTTNELLYKTKLKMPM